MSLAVAFGTGLALWHLRATDGASRPPVLVGIVHGVIGATGLVFFLLALRGPPRGVAAGAGSFGEVAAVLFALALAIGIVLLIRRRRGAFITMSIHSAVAITAYVVLLAWYVVG